ncbi:MAG: 5-(carboxyamino)imidazole ribonucleotide synthase [Candidatus Ancillula sp.]|jgi:5-(carboxyamino)imidazole ribonucleotide synthase|nr:5-(carboxyamino)imidazole ribonucleotide synthase [Candidatus Ancillula sp.]
MRIGVIGGGQLARMMAPAVSELDLEFYVLVEALDGAAGKIFPNSTVGEANDIETVLNWVKKNNLDVVTFEHEHVPNYIIDKINDLHVAVYPDKLALRFAQNKILMREKLSEIHLPCPDFTVVKNIGELQVFMQKHGGQAVLKTATGGYDGKGVLVVKEQDSQSLEIASKWFEKSFSSTADINDPEQDPRLLVEELVPFTRELAALVVRSSKGEIKAWDTVESIQENSVCKTVIAPAPDLGKNDKAKKMAIKIAEELGVVGVLAVEMFEVVNSLGISKILINELAMRPHNSGHWTINGSVTSQFENHLRAVAGLPLGNTDRINKEYWTVMENILGSTRKDLRDAKIDAMSVNSSAKINLYGKGIRPGRKLGHINLSGEDLQEVREDVKKIGNIFQGITL